MSTDIQGNFVIYMLGTIQCSIGTVIVYLGVSNVGGVILWEEIFWLVFSGKGVVGCCLDGWKGWV